MDPETLSADELAYHRALVARVKAAQAAWQSWSDHIGAKYRLTEGDAISEDGDVLRRRPPAAAAPAPSLVPSSDGG